MARQDWLDAHPTFPFLIAGDTAAVAPYLLRLGELALGETLVSAEKAGEGNMNLTLRVVIRGKGGGERSVIVKQSRPWVEKYDFIDAPWDRANVEGAFYSAVAGVTEVASMMPVLLGADAGARVLVFEDLGAAADLFSAYDGVAIPVATLVALAGYARALHVGTRGRFEPGLVNREMRALNAQHIYEIPLADPPAMDLEGIEAGLGEAARVLREDAGFVGVVRETGQRYLGDGACLLHGDFFPGSWLMVGGVVKVIDPEFCFFGPAEFDVAVALAHLALARQPVGSAEAFLGAYGEKGLDMALVGRFAGVEVMRRLIGVAQLPIPKHGGRAGLLLRARGAVVSGDIRKLW